MSLEARISLGYKAPNKSFLVVRDARGASPRATEICGVEGHATDRQILLAGNSPRCRIVPTASKILLTTSALEQSAIQSSFFILYLSPLKCRSDVHLCTVFRAGERGLAGTEKDRNGKKAWRLDFLPTQGRDPVSVKRARLIEPSWLFPFLLT